MVRKKAPSDRRLLTEVELEIMSIVWQLGSATVKDVRQALPAERDLAYTSVATMLKILEQKGYLSSRPGTPAYIYTPLIDKAAYESASVQSLVEQVFEGEPTSLIARLLDDRHLDQAALDKIRSLLDRKERR